MTRTQEDRILNSASTRTLVYRVLGLAEMKDPVDAIADVRTALDILESRWNRSVCKEEGCVDSPGSFCRRCKERL